MTDHFVEPPNEQLKLSLAQACVWLRQASPCINSRSTWCYMTEKVYE